MNQSFNSQMTPGMFVPTSNVWDVSEIYNIQNITPELKELLVRLYQNLNNMSLALNAKDTGYYIQQEFMTGQVYFPNPAYSSFTQQAPTLRGTYRTVVNFGALPNTTTKSIPHYINITDAYSFTRIYGVATKTSPFSSIPLPFSSPTLNENIKVSIDNAYVSVTTDIDYSAYTICYIVVEYIKS